MEVLKKDMKRYTNLFKDLAHDTLQLRNIYIYIYFAKRSHYIRRKIMSYKINLRSLQQQKTKHPQTVKNKLTPTYMVGIRI